MKQTDWPQPRAARLPLSKVFAYRFKNGLGEIDIPSKTPLSDTYLTKLTDFSLQLQRRSLPEIESFSNRPHQNVRTFDVLELQGHRGRRSRAFSFC